MNIDIYSLKKNDSMENENMEKTILTDEELQEVAGGAKITDGKRIAYALDRCEKQRVMLHCKEISDCAWIDNQCIASPLRFDYDYKNASKYY
jgi:hypothetical protein